MKLETFRSVCLWVIRIGLWIVPFIPLYVSNRLFFPYITGKAFLFRTIVEVVFVAWVLLMIFFREARFHWKPLTIAVSVFIAVLALATVFGVNPYRSFWSNFERMEGFVTYLHLFAYFLVLTHVFRPKDWSVFWNLFLVSGVIQNGYALFQKLGYLKSPQGGFRVDGTIGNPTYVAAYLVFVLAIAVLLFMQSKGPRVRTWYGFVAGFSVLTIYFTATRGVILALFIGLLAAGIFYLVKRRGENSQAKLIKRIVAGFLIVLVVSAVAVKAFRGSEFVRGSEILSRLSSISLKEGTSRFIIWNMGLQGFKERPVLGWGPENYNIIFAKYYSPKLYTQEPWFDRSHNVVFDWLISAGVLGLSSFLGMLVVATYMLWRGVRGSGMERVAFLFSILFFVYLLQNLFVFDQLVTYLSLFAVFAYIGSSAWRGANAAERAATVPTFAWWRPVVGVGFIFAVVASWYFVVWKPLGANLALIEAMSHRSAGEAEATLAAFERAFSYRSLGDQEIREQFAQFTIGAVGSSAVGDALKSKTFLRAVDELYNGTLDAPRDPRTHLFSGSVLRAGGRLDDAIAAFERALALSPTKQQIAFELADTYLRKNDVERAVALLEHAYELEPRFDEAVYNLAATYVISGRQEDADKLLVEAYGRTDVPVQILAQVYELRRDFPRLLGIWKAFTESEPQNTDYWKKVTGLLLELGKSKEAIEALEKAIAANPNFKEEGEGYIAEIRAGNF